MSSQASATLSDLQGTRDYVAEVEAALVAKDFGRANSLARAGLLAGVEAPLLLNVAAFGLEQEGRLDAAMQLLERALQLAPGDAATLSSIGHWQSNAARPAEALAALDQALAIAPGLASAHHGRGLALAALKDFKGAWTSQSRALALDPHNPDILGAMSGLAANNADMAAARDYAERALALDPLQSSAAVAVSAMDLQAGRVDEAIARMRALIDRGGMTGLHASSAHRLLADALEANGDYAGAFQAYVVSNRILRATNQQMFEAEGVERGPDLCRRLAAFFAGMAPGSWSAPSNDQTQTHPVAQHVFLVGFPRSGTTLLEQVLATHEQVVALEEKPTLGEVGADFFERDTIDRLVHLDAATADALRKTYWNKVRQLGVEPGGRVFVDKLPLATLWLPYIAKLFPKAKVLFARRDPRDVVLSCFRRRFLMNGGMYDFTDLTQAARFYAGVMEVAEVYRGLLDLDWYVHRHEDLVQDFAGETRRLCAFLELGWTDKLSDFAETAKRRDVQTPSATQVRKGLYSSGMGQWRRYGDALAPIFPVLQPWVERFGYPTV